MATSTTICNQAMDAVGGSHITLLGSDNTLEDNLCNAAFDEIRDQVLRDHPWNCAIKRAVLAENLLLYSETFDNAAWVKTNATVTADQIRSPDGQISMDLLTDADGGNAGTVAQAISVPNNADNHTLSVYLKQGTAAVSRVTLGYSGGTPVSSDVDVTWAATPTVSAGTITDVGGGYWRLSVTLANNSSGNTTLTATLYPAGATAAATGTVYAWGALIGQTDSVTGYCATTATASQPIYPQFGFKYGWPLPADFLAACDVDEGDLQYKIESGYLVDDSAEVSLKYVFKQTDYDVLDPLLQELIGLRLAARLAPSLCGSDERKDKIQADLKMAEAKAKTRDAQEDGEDNDVEDPWILARRGP